MTEPELEALREKLTRAILDIMDDAFASSETEQEGVALNPPKPVQWGGPEKLEELKEFLTGAKPVSVRVDESVLVDRAARRMKGEVLDPLTFETPMDDRDPVDPGRTRKRGTR